MNVLCIVAHMDDAEISCAGTLLRYAKQGDKTHLVVVTDGDKGSYTLSPEELTATRREEQLRAAKILQIESVHFLGYEDDFLMDSKQLRLDLINIMRKTQAEVILTHSVNDGSNDHATTARAVTASLIALPWPNVVTEALPFPKLPAVFMFDPAGGVDFLPEIIVDITAEIETKRTAFACHESQACYDPRYAQSVELISKFRGFQAGYEYGEAYRAHRFFGYMPDFRLLPR